MGYLHPRCTHIAPFLPGSCNVKELASIEINRRLFETNLDAKISIEEKMQEPPDGISSDNERCEGIPSLDIEEKLRLLSRH